jgi:Mg-chelatase subunit ChlD
MRGRELPDAKAAAKSFINYLQLSSDQVALVSFAGEASLDQRLTHNGQSVKKAIDRLSASGSTAIGDAIAAAQQELSSKRHNRSAAPVLILLTDGENTKGRDPLRAAEAAKAAGTRIIVIGLGQVQEAELRALASTHADYYYAPTSSQIAEIYASIAKSVCRTSTSHASENLVSPQQHTDERDSSGSWALLRQAITMRLFTVIWSAQQ